MILEAHRSRRAARARERKLQRLLDRAWRAPDVRLNGRLLDEGVPGWARGVRVESIGATHTSSMPWPKGTPAVVRNRRQYAVVATRDRGR